MIIVDNSAVIDSDSLVRIDITKEETTALNAFNFFEKMKMATLDDCIVCGSTVDYNGRFQCCYACVKFHKRYKSTIAPRCRNFQQCETKQLVRHGKKRTEDGRVWRGICAGCRWLKVKNAFEKGEIAQKNSRNKSIFKQQQSICFLPLQNDSAMEQTLLQIVKATIDFKNGMQLVSQFDSI